MDKAQDLVEAIIADPAGRRVSAIHLEPAGRMFLLRARSSGGLVELARLDAAEGRALAAALKARAGLVGDDAAAAQGRIGGGREWLVSTYAAPAGERIVLSLALREADERHLDVPGMAPPLERLLRRALAQRSGIILFAGPQGSGRADTAAAALRHLDDGSRAVLALAASQDAAAAFDAALLQDADALLAPEIVDRRSAEALFRAAGQGPLIVSTIRASDAVAALARLREFRIDPFLVASLLRVLVAQRRVRRLCEQCRAPVQATGSACALLGFDPGTVLFEGRGCAACGGSGHGGETGLFEAIEMDDAMRRLINAGADEAMIANQAFRDSPDLGAAARALVRDGAIAAEDAVALSREAAESRRVCSGLIG